MVLMAPGGKVPKDRSWKAGKIMMAKVKAVCLGFDLNAISGQRIRKVT